MRWRERAALVLLATPFVVGGLVGASAAGPGGGHEVCALSDWDITEASGLVAMDGLFVTMNDSGDSARVFALDAHTCKTVGVTHWHADALDDEGLAPAGPGQVWVGDIGDNYVARHTITVARVPIGHGSRTVAGEVRTLAYPDGPHDAETLLRDPADGRLYVVTKEFIGHVYAAPAGLHAGVNKMSELPTAVIGLATDGAFFPDGRHLVLRSYGQAAIYTWPAMARVATLDLPHQEQGEGISVGSDDRLYLSSEGGLAPVLEVTLPEKVRAALSSDTPAADGGHLADDDPADGVGWWPWVAGGGALAAGLAGVAVVLRRR